MKEVFRALSEENFEQLSEFRYQMRRFERFSEQAAQDAGITPLQYLLLLQIKGYPDRDWATVGEISERLQAHHHGVAALLLRLYRGARYWIRSSERPAKLIVAKSRFIC